MTTKPIEVVGDHRKDIPSVFYEFVNEYLIPSMNGRTENVVLAAMLGGSHSKGLMNSRSDADLIVYYTTSAKNLLRFNWEPLSIVPEGHGFIQTGAEAVKYLYEGMEYEVLMVPVRRVDEGNDLFTNLMKSNVKTLHDLYKDYDLFLPDPRSWNAVVVNEFGCLIEDLKDPEKFDLSVDAVGGYFHGYMKSQLMSHRRRTDFEKREKKAWETYDVNPVVKAIMNGLYIGLSGLYLLDERAVSRDFRVLWEKYSPLFNFEQRTFVEMCWRHKTDRELITMHVDQFLEMSAVMRDGLFTRLDQRFELSKVDALSEGRFLLDVDQKKNARLLDAYQLYFLELEA